MIVLMFFRIVELLSITINYIYIYIYHISYIICMYIDLYLLIFHNFPGFIVMYPGHVYCRLVPCFSVFYVVLIIFDTWPVNNMSGSFSLYQQSQKTFFQHTLYTISHLFFFETTLRQHVCCSLQANEQLPTVTVSKT